MRLRPSNIDQYNQQRNSPYYNRNNPNQLGQNPISQIDLSSR